LASYWYKNLISRIFFLIHFFNIAAVDVDRIARDMDFQALQDNLEQITLCNIDAEVVSLYLKIQIFILFRYKKKDTRAMDPNFIKLYKMAQLTIEYLLVCL